MGHYQNLAKPPADALKKIQGHPRLNGKTDINPQWRYEALTQEYGDYGQGWYVEVVNTFTQDIQDTHELMIFAVVNLYVKHGEEWSKPAVGFGGDYLIKRNKNGLSGNDEAYKMAITDAIGTAAKMFGVAADVYRGKMENGYSDSKYSPRNAQEAPQQTKQQWTGKTLLDNLNKIIKEQGMESGDVTMMIQQHYGKNKWNELTQSEKIELGTKTMEIWDSVMKKLGGAA